MKAIERAAQVLKKIRFISYKFKSSYHIFFGGRHWHFLGSVLGVGGGRMPQQKTGYRKPTLYYSVGDLTFNVARMNACNFKNP